MYYFLFVFKHKMATGTNSFYKDMLNESYLDSDLDVDYSTIVNLTTSNLIPLSNNVITVEGNMQANNFIGHLQGNADTAMTAVSFTRSLAGDIISTMNAIQISARVIVDSDISASAAIEDTKLGTIQTSSRERLVLHVGHNYIAFSHILKFSSHSWYTF